MATIPTPGELIPDWDGTLTTAYPHVTYTNGISMSGTSATSDIEAMRQELDTLKQQMLQSQVYGHQHQLQPGGPQMATWTGTPQVWVDEVPETHQNVIDDVLEL